MLALFTCGNNEHDAGRSGWSTDNLFPQFVSRPLFDRSSVGSLFVGFRKVGGLNHQEAGWVTSPYHSGLGPCHRRVCSEERSPRVIFFHGFVRLLISAAALPLFCIWMNHPGSTTWVWPSTVWLTSPPRACRETSSATWSSSSGTTSPTFARRLCLRCEPLLSLMCGVFACSKRGVHWAFL